MRHQVLSVVLLATLFGCNENVRKQSSLDGPLLSMSSISYADVSTNVFNQRCLECHGTGKRLPTLEGYENAKANAVAAMNSINAGRMPSGYSLSANSKQILALWIAKGMPLDPVPVDNIEGGGDNTTDPVLPPLAPTYASLNEHIFKARCIACHSADSERLQPLVTREDITNPRAGLVDFDRPERSYLLEIIRNRTNPPDNLNDDDIQMPPPRSNFTAVPEEQIQVLEEWIRLGAPE